MLTQNEAMGAATASDGGSAPVASLWVRIMTSCISIKRGVYQHQCDTISCANVLNAPERLLEMSCVSSKIASTISTETIANQK